MPKRPHQPSGPPHSPDSHIGWSIGANGLTPAGRSQLLKYLGKQLQADYQGVLREPAPDTIKVLLQRLELHGHEVDLGEET